MPKLREGSPDVRSSKWASAGGQGKGGSTGWGLNRRKAETAKLDANHYFDSDKTASARWSEGFGLSGPDDLVSRFLRSTLRNPTAPSSPCGMVLRTLLSQPPSGSGSPACQVRPGNVGMLDSVDASQLPWPQTVTITCLTGIPPYMMRVAAGPGQPAQSLPTLRDPLGRPWPNRAWSHPAARRRPGERPCCPLPQRRP